MNSPEEKTSPPQRRCATYARLVDKTRSALLETIAAASSKPSAGAYTDQKRLVDTPIMEGYVSRTIEQIEQSRKIFIDDIKQLIVLFSALFIASGIVVGFALEQDSLLMVGLLLIAAALPLAMLQLVIRAAKRKAWAAYQLYVTSATHAAVVHEALGLPCSHQWLARAKTCAESIEESEQQKCDILEWHRQVVWAWTNLPSADQSLGHAGRAFHGKAADETLYLTVIRLFGYAEFFTLASYALISLFFMARAICG